MEVVGRDYWRVMEGLHDQTVCVKSDEHRFVGDVAQCGSREK